MKTLLLIGIADRKTVYVSKDTVSDYQEALLLLQENRVRQKQLLEFIHAIRNVDLLLKMTPTEKRRILPQLGKDFTVAIFDENVEKLRDDTFYDPPLATFRTGKGEPPLIGAGLIGIRGSDHKMYTQDIVYYEGRWCFGYASP